MVTPLLNESQSQSSPLPNLSYHSQTNFLERTVVELPAQVGFRKDWEKVGIVWKDKLETPTNIDEPMFAEATLPAGWRLLNEFSKNPNIEQFELQDEEGVKRVNLTILYRNSPEMSSNSKRERIFGLAEFHHENIEAAVRTSQRKIKIPQDKQLVVASRKESWSEESSFLVIYTAGQKQGNSDLNIKWSRAPKVRLGFFTREIAFKARTLLGEEGNHIYYPSAITVYDSVVCNVGRTEVASVMSQYAADDGEILRKWSSLSGVESR